MCNEQMQEARCSGAAVLCVGVLQYPPAHQVGAEAIAAVGSLDATSSAAEDANLMRRKKCLCNWSYLGFGHVVAIGR